jgi:pilus assembly protein CpaF
MSETNSANGERNIPNNDDGVTHLPRTDADKGREPKVVYGRLGTRMYSVAALVEKIVAAFHEEHGDESAVLLDADTPTKRMKLLLATTDYVLAVESVLLASDEKADVMSRVYSELFSYGPLDALFRDATVTTISLDGYDKVSVRYGHGDLVPMGPVFEDQQHLRQVIIRLLRDSGAMLTEDQPYLEVGLIVDGRPICVNLVAPPISIQLRADIRVHPKTLPTLDDLVAAEFMPAAAATFLKALVAAPHGFIIVGDTESGKTTLLSVLAQFLPQPEQTVAVERAGELRLPMGAQRLSVRWPVGEQPEVSFGQQVNAALSKNPACIILDEVRADQPEAIAPLLSQANPPRQIWSFRGSADDKRLRSALGMVARRADTSQSEALVQNLYRRLPFIITLKRTKGSIRLRSIAEWQFPVGSDYPDYVEIMTTGWEGLELSGKRPAHELPLTADFWT